MMIFRQLVVLLVLANALVSSSQSVTFQCRGETCPSGQDCLTVSGSSRCADPCKHYSVLDDAWRASNRSKDDVGDHCDKKISWNGWYRMFLGGDIAQMPEKCVEKRMCGTHASLWLKDPHPVLADGVQQRGICGSWTNGCCHFKEKPIHVKACPGNHRIGNYYVYKFIQPTDCSLAYCADASNTRPIKVCETCQRHEDCEFWFDGDINWECKRKVVNPKLECGRSSMKVGFLLATLEDAGLDASSAHLLNASCSFYQEQNGTVWYQLDYEEKICGTTLKTNSTHIIYSNTVFMAPDPNVTLVRPRIFPFSCTYSLEMETSLDLGRTLPLTEDEVTAERPRGKATMSLFYSSNYSQAYPAGVVVLSPDTVLYVGVSVEETVVEDYVVVLEDCYATYTPDPENNQKHFLIRDRCEIDPRRVLVTESGVSLKGRFSAELFKFDGDYQQVFLHCSLSMCDKMLSSCTPNCSKRVQRSIADSPSITHHLTIGPIVFEGERK